MSFELESKTQVKITDIAVLSHKNRAPTDNPSAQLKILAKLKDGGTVEVSFSIECPDISEKVFGKLATMKSCDVEVTLVAPEVDGEFS